MTNNCLNCQFLCEEDREVNTGRATCVVLDSDKRETLRREPDGFDRGWYTLKCHMGVWDENANSTSISNDKDLLTVERGHSCFFIPHQPAMLLPAAIELQKRNEANRQLKTSHLSTQIGLWIAGTGLLINAIVHLISAL